MTRPGIEPRSPGPLANTLTALGQKTLLSSEHCRSGRPQSEKKMKEIEKRDKYLNLARELKKNAEHEGDGDTTCCWCTRSSPVKVWKKDWRNWKLKNRTTEFQRSIRIHRRFLDT